jgi:hypothetical protein
VSCLGLVLLPVEKPEMFKRLIVCSIAMFLALGCGMPLFCRGLVWRFLGDARIRGGQDHDKIQVDGQQGPFRAVQLRVSGDDFFCQRIVVNYRDAASEELAVGGRISTEGRDRIIDFKGGAHMLKSVELWYFKESWEHAPHVTLYGTR